MGSRRHFSPLQALKSHQNRSKSTKFLYFSLFWALGMTLNLDFCGFWKDIRPSQGLYSGIFSYFIRIFAMGFGAVDLFWLGVLGQLFSDTEFIIAPSRTNQQTSTTPKPIENTFQFYFQIPFRKSLSKNTHICC